MTGRRSWALAALVFAGVLVADQVTKALVRGGMARGAEDPVFPFLKLVNVRNEGVAFGLDVGGATVIVIIIAVALAALLAYFARHAKRPLMWLPVGMLLGGALGNIVDRLREGAVTDFLKIPAWPAFNLADVSITLGVITLIYVMERRDEPDPHRA